MYAPENGLKISTRSVLAVLADFDKLGGGSAGLVAWELCVAEPDVAAAWADAIKHGWITSAGRDRTHDEEIWRLTSTGWRANAARGGAEPLI